METVNRKNLSTRSFLLSNGFMPPSPAVGAISQYDFLREAGATRIRTVPILDFTLDMREIGSILKNVGQEPLMTIPTMRRRPDLAGKQYLTRCSESLS